MKNFWRFAALSAASLLALASLNACSEEEETTKSYLSGTIKITFPSYVQEGYSKTFCIDSISTLNRDGDYTKIAYNFTDIHGTVDTLIDTDGNVKSKYFTITAPDSLDSFSASITGYATDYYTSSSTVTFYVVSDNKSLTGIRRSLTDTQFTDPRDNKTYWVTHPADGKAWMGQNLKFEGLGVPFMEENAMVNLLGNFYTWNEALQACPEGWHLPSDSEWTALAGEYGGQTADPLTPFIDIEGAAGALMADVYFNDIKMWEYWPTVNISNASGLAVIPAGYAVWNGSYSFAGYSYYAVFWTSDESGDQGIYRQIFDDQNIIFCGGADKDSFLASVRCVRD